MTESAARDVDVQQIDAVLRYLPLFEREGFSPGEWQTQEGQLPYFASSPEVDAFVQTVYEHGILCAFDWMAWQDEAQQYRSEPGSLAQADLLTVRKLLTLHVRADRFVEGHLARAFEKGEVVAILRRLKHLREEMAGSA
jgi:ADP-ribosyl-[dinitrogen reductase] hydrolase